MLTFLNYRNINILNFNVILIDLNSIVLFLND